MKRFMHGLAYGAILWMTGLLPVKADVAPDLWNKPVRYIRIESDYPLEKQSVMRILTLKEGDLLTQAAVRTSLQNISYLRRFQQVIVSALAFEDGAMIIFKLEPEWMVSSVRFVGKQTGYLFAYGLESRISKKEILRHCTLRENEIYTDQKLLKTIRNLEELYAEYGYGKCEIIPDLTKLDERKKIAVTFRISKNEPTLIRDVTFIGNETIPDSVLKNKVDSRPGRRFLERKLDSDMEDLRDFYLRKGFFKIRIRRPEYSYIPEKNMVDIVFSVEEHEAMSIRIDAPAHFWNLSWWFYKLERKPNTLFEVLGLADTELIDDELLHQATDRLTAKYTSRGYAFAEGELTVIDTETGRNRYLYAVNQGSKVDISKINIEGNETFADEILDDYIVSSEGKSYDPAEFEEDCRSVRLYYQNQGFQNATVEGTLQNFDPESSKVALVIRITEGFQTTIQSITVKGNDTIDGDELLSLSGLSVEQPYFPAAIENAKIRIASEYRRRGFSDISVDTQITFDKSRKSTRVDISINEGNRTVFGKTIIRGVQKTKRSVIDRNTLDIEDEPFNLETIQKMERNLSQTGLFASVQAESPLIQANEPRRNVIIALQERSSLYLETGPGYNTDSGLNGYLSFYTTNLFGTNRYLGSSIYVTEISDKSQITFREPEFAGYPIQMEIRLFRTLTREDGYRLFRYGGRANWTYRFSSRARAILEYRLDEDRPMDIEVGTTIPDEYRNSVKIGSLAPAFLYDSRNDPRNPVKGQLFSLKVEFAREVYDSEVDFTKTIFEGFQFLELLPEQVLGLAFRCGWGRDLPFQERFKLGGIKTIRGWGYEDIAGSAGSGLRQEGSNVQGTGGNTFMLGNLEWRVPLVWSFIGVVFIDSGNVWESVDNIRLDELKTSIGLGLRFMTPIGPVGVDYAYNVMRDDEDPRYRWSVVIGHTF
ncbi:outer membrane protein assembly factor BamA [bacterium]|nr:outer membrane protein assembly factor BamA [candidate division CSSED10-310 bacterium]